MTPAALWPLIADTERLNRALGLLPVHYRTALYGGKPVLLAKFRVAGVPISRWIEHPFEWEEPYRHSVRREYLSGPLRQAVIGVELTPDGEGTEVRPWITVEPRNPLGAALAQWGAAPRWTRGLLAQCRIFERYLLGQAGSPFPQLQPRAGLARGRLETLAAQLVKAGKDSALVGRLLRHLAEAPNVDVTSMRPFELADRWNADRRAVLGLFLEATVVGLLEMSWHVLCPNCRVTKAQYGRLQRLEEYVHCDTCQARFGVDFDRLVEVRFDPARGVREVHQETFCLVGPWNSPHVVTQAILAAGEVRRLGARLEPGPYRLRTLRGESAIVRAMNGAPLSVEFTIANGTPQPGETEVGAGRAEVGLRNDGPGEAVVMLERAEWLDTVATGAVVGTMPEFRHLFSAEVLAPGLEVRVQRLAFLFTDVAGSTAMYERVGDARAFRLVQEHFQILADAVAAHRGALVKTIGDAVMAVFPTGADAVEAAVTIQRDIRRLDCQGVADPAQLVRVGVHEGPCVAVNLNDRLDYFGTTLNMAARIEHESHGGEVVASAAVVEDSEAMDRLRALPVEVEPFEAQLRGISECVRLYRIRPRWDAVTHLEPAPQSSALPTA